MEKLDLMRWILIISWHKAYEIIYLLSFVAEDRTYGAHSDIRTLSNEIY